MPRAPRIYSSTGIYHIILRSVNQQIIFQEDEDFKKFLFILLDCQKKYDVDILAYCLMTNHIHLLIHSDSSLLSSFFQSLGTRFVRWYNIKYNRFGHLFQDRFFSKPVEDKDYYLSILIYIHNNPVNAGICNFASEYQWSSYRIFLGSKNNLINLSFSYSIIGSRESLLHLFSIKANDSNITNENDEYENQYSHKHISDEQAILIYKRLTKALSIFDAQRLSKVQRNDIIRSLREEKLTINQISRLLGVSPKTVQRVKMTS